MINIVGIDHLVLRTTQLTEMTTFYCQYLGCIVEREIPELGLTQLRAGKALIDLVLVDSELGRIGGGPATTKENNLDHFCLQLTAASMESLQVYLSDCGITFEQAQRRYGATGFGLSLYVQDPDGNTVELKPNNPNNENTGE